MDLRVRICFSRIPLFRAMHYAETRTLISLVYLFRELYGFRAALDDLDDIAEAIFLHHRPGMLGHVRVLNRVHLEIRTQKKSEKRGRGRFRLRSSMQYCKQGTGVRQADWQQG